MAEFKVSLLFVRGMTLEGLPRHLVSMSDVVVFAIL